MLLLIVSSFLPTSATGAAETFSWGKPGASRADFERGGIDCALEAARSDVSKRPETEQYVKGFNVLERENNMPPVVDGDDVFTRAERQVLLRRMYNPNGKVNALQRHLQGDVETCLTSAGYTKYALSREQAKRLKKLKPGSDARKAYLYSLGSDAEVVGQQRVAPPETP